MPTKSTNNFSFLLLWAIGGGSTFFYILQSLHGVVDASAEPFNFVDDAYGSVSIFWLIPFFLITHSQFKLGDLILESSVNRERDIYIVFLAALTWSLSFLAGFLLLLTNGGSAYAQ